MSPDIGIAQLLLATNAVTAITGTRIYPNFLPKGATYPAISYQRISTVPTVTFSGTVFRQARIQINMFSTVYDDVRAIEEQIVALLDSFCGHLPNGLYCSILLDNSLDLPTNDDLNLGLYRAGSDFLVQF